MKVARALNSDRDKGGKSSHLQVKTRTQMKEEINKKIERYLIKRGNN
jgi:hypothetical protein